MQSNLTGFIEDESRKSIAVMAEKGQLVCFPTEGVYGKPVYDKLQDLPGNYLVVQLQVPPLACSHLSDRLFCLFYDCSKFVSYGLRVDGD